MFEIPPLWMLPIRIISSICIQYCLVSMIDALLMPRWNIRHLRLWLAVSMAGIVSIVSISLPPSVRVIFNTVLYLCTIIIFYRGRLAIQLLVFAFQMVFLLCAECIAITITGTLGWLMNSLTAGQQLVMDCLCSALMAILSHLFRGAVRFIDDHLDRRLWGNLILTGIGILCSAAIIVFNNYINNGADANTWIGKNLNLFNACALLLPPLTMIGIFSLIHRLNISIREAEEAHFAEQQALMQLERNQIIISKDSEYRQLRHDIKNHLLAIDALGQRQEYERQHEYLTSLYAAFEQTQIHQYCGHPLIDSIFQTKNRLMENAGITAVWNLSVIPESIPFSDLDLCALIGNLMDNAIEACERIPEDQPRHVETTLRWNEQGLAFQVINTSVADTNLVKSGMKSSKKPTREGIGLRSVERIVKSNNGEMLLIPTDNGKKLEISIYLPIPQHS